MGLLRRLTARPASRGLVLLYHRVADAEVDPWGLCTTPVHFAEHLQVLREQWLPVPLAELMPKLRAGRSSRPPVAVTFDDGYAHNLESACPLLERYGIPATFFLTTGCMRQHAEFWWDELERLLLQEGSLPTTLSIKIDAKTEHWHLGESRHASVSGVRAHRSWRAWEEPPTERHAIYYTIWKRLYGMLPTQRRAALRELSESIGAERTPRSTHRALVAEEVATLARASLVEIGAHTVNHPPLSALPLEAQKQEIAQSKADLEELTGRPVASFAYPHGDYSRGTIPLVRQAGFARACSTEPRLVARGSDPFELPRLAVRDWDGDAFARQLVAWSRKAPA